MAVQSEAVGHWRDRSRSADRFRGADPVNAWQTTSLLFDPCTVPASTIDSACFPDMWHELLQILRKVDCRSSREQLFENSRKEEQSVIQSNDSIGSSNVSKRRQYWFNPDLT